MSRSLPPHNSNFRYFEIKSLVLRTSNLRDSTIPEKQHGILKTQHWHLLDAGFCAGYPLVTCKAVPLQSWAVTYRNTAHNERVHEVLI